jgi:acetyl-CoA carboxylase carboxyl transferase subunit beta
VNWINNVVRPKIRSFLTTKREVPENLWVKCPETGQMVFYKDLEANQFVVPGSNYHMKMNARARLAHLFDGASFEIVPSPTVAQDPLRFRDGRRYTDRLKDARTKTGLDDAVLIGEGALDGVNVVAAAQDFEFMAGSLGMAAGEAVIAGMLRAVEKKAPFILFSASGGARMQEGILSLMQMPRTTIAVQRLRQAKLPYIVVLTDPTTGGVTASYAMLGDVHIAEPGALICFAGPRVIQQTIREQLPDGFQRSEYLLSHGMIDMVVHRHKLRETLSRICSILMHEGEIGRGTGKSRKVNGGNGRNHVNVGAPDGRLIEAGVRGTGTALIEPEPVDEDERFGARQSDGRDKPRTDGPTTRSGGKDGSRS